MRRWITDSPDLFKNTIATILFGEIKQTTDINMSEM